MDIQRPGTSARRRKRYLIVGTVACGFLLLCGLAWDLNGRPPAVDGNDLWSASVKRGEFVYEISAAGKLVAPEIRAVTNRSEGVVERIRVLPGQVVEPGDVLIDMTSPQLLEDVAKARSDLKIAEANVVVSRIELENKYLDSVAQLASAKADYTSARLEVEAQEKLAASATKSDIDIKRLRLTAEQRHKRLDAEQAKLDGFGEYRKAQVAVKQAELSQKRENMHRLQSQVSALHVSAGVHGIIQEINVEEGQRLAVGQAVARIVNPDYLIARVGVSERDTALVALGQPVRVEIGTGNIKGKVVRIDPTVRDRLVTVDVSLGQHSSQAVRPDLSVTARIEVERIENALMLDRPTTVRDGSETVTLFRLAPDGDTADRVSVRIGRVTPRKVEILGGLKKGDRVILADLSDWRGEPLIRIR